eukprot:2860214-Prymnesium_polylepis.1
MGASSPIRDKFCRPAVHWESSETNSRSLAPALSRPRLERGSFAFGTVSKLLLSVSIARLSA